MRFLKVKTGHFLNSCGKFFDSKTLDIRLSNVYLILICVKITL